MQESNHLGPKNFAAVRSAALAFCLLLAVFCGSGDAAAPTPEPPVGAVEALPNIHELPDPFLFTSGRRVVNREQWRERREEIKEILLRYEYGHVAPAPEKWSAREVSGKAWLGGRMTLVAMTLDMGDFLNMAVRVYRPSGDGPFPAVLNLGDDGSKAAVAFARGYMLVTCSPEVDLDPDTEGPRHGWSGPAWPVRLAIGDRWRCGPGERVAPWTTLETRRDVQADHVIVRGHSRMGKAALLAGALDERFAMVAPNGSGTGGASVYRVRNSGAETLASITSPKRFASWFQRDFGRFGDREDHLSVRSALAARPGGASTAVVDRGRAGQMGQPPRQPGSGRGRQPCLPIPWLARQHRHPHPARQPREPG